MPSKSIAREWHFIGEVPKVKFSTSLGQLISHDIWYFKVFTLIRMVVKLPCLIVEANATATKGNHHVNENFSTIPKSQQTTLQTSIP